MSARENSGLQSAASQIHTLSCDSEIACLNLSILLGSIVKSLDDSGGDPDDRFDQINCYVGCARPILATVLEHSLAAAKIAHEVSA